jgi:hypothetical protein
MLVGMSPGYIYMRNISTITTVYCITVPSTTNKENT